MILKKWAEYTTADILDYELSIIMSTKMILKIADISNKILTKI